MNKTAGISPFLDSKTAIFPFDTAYFGNSAILKKVFLWVGLVLVVLLMVESSAFGANHYVRQGATGSANGSDWTNACTDFTGSCAVSSMVRGDTYYVADGSYASRDFDRAVSGTSVITIKKATIADHGTDTGWSSAYGDGQAIFSGGVVGFRTSYWVFNGQTRNESDWYDRASYGFRVSANATGDHNVAVTGNNVTVSYVYAPGVPNTADMSGFNAGSSPVVSGVIFSRVYAQYGNQHFWPRGSTGTIFEYCASSDGRSTSDSHGNIVNLYGLYGSPADYTIVRYCRFKDNFYPGGYSGSPFYSGTSVVSTAGVNGAEVYGNLFEGNCNGDGTIGWNGSVADHYVTNMKIYNNTFVPPTSAQCPNGGGALGIALNDAGSSGNVAYNNLFVTTGSVTLSPSNSTFTHDYSGFLGSNAYGESHAQTNIPTSIFTNYSGRIFSLASATTAGITLSPPYNTDILGNTRGAVGVWDRGAYEFPNGNPPPPVAIPNPPSNLQVQ